ncbi:MAG: Lrp/AsnC ligand binding domain-containing protein [Methanotrichaceae archaeon]
MVIGLTMIKVRPGYEKSAYRTLQKRSEIKDIYHLFGEFSFFLVMQAEGKPNLDKLMMDIRKGDMVVKTSPVMVAIGSDHADSSFLPIAERGYN